MDATSRHMRRTLPFLLAALAATPIALGGCGETGSGSSTAGSSPDASTATARVALHLDVGSFSSDAPSATIAGTVTPGAAVTVNHHHASVHGHRWSKTLHLHLGHNRLSVAATLTGRRSAHKSIVVTREKSAAEREAERREREAEQEAERRKREAKRHEHETASTTSPPPEACTKGTYTNSAGKTVCRPEESPSAPAGATAECADGTYSFSESRSGTCSHHGGVARWLK